MRSMGWQRVPYLLQGARCGRSPDRPDESSRGAGPRRHLWCIQGNIRGNWTIRRLYQRCSCLPCGHRVHAGRDWCKERAEKAATVPCSHGRCEYGERRTRARLLLLQRNPRKRQCGRCLPVPRRRELPVTLERQTPPSHIPQGAHKWSQSVRRYAWRPHGY